MTASHLRIAALIERQFIEGLSAEDRRVLTDHLRDCAPCQRLYDRYAGAEEQLFAGPQGVAADWTAGAQERVEAGLFGGAPPPRRSWRAPLALVATAVTATAAALLVAPVEGTEAEELAARGAPAARADVPPAQVGLRALRVRVGADGPQIADLASEGVRLRDGDHVALLYVNHEGAARVRAWLEVGPRAARQLLVEARAARSGVEDARLGAPIPVADWPSGTLSIVAEFTVSDGRRLTRRVEVTKEGP